jgi:hypothetical protein
MTSISTSIDIDAPRAAVWATLTDLSSYPEWNPHVTRADGTLREGEPLEIRVEREGDRAREMTVTITDVEPERRFEWVGTVGFRWLFEGRHVFELEALDGDRTRLHNREEVSGPLQSLIVTDDPERDYVAMNEALKARVERTTEAGIEA